MEKPLSPQQSLDIIGAVIEQSKRKYEENGHFILMWGLAIILAGVSQFALIKMGEGRNSGFAWVVTMIPMAIYTTWSSIKENKQDKKEFAHQNPNLSGLAWSMAGTMAMLTGFIFSAKFGAAMTAVMFLPFCVAAFVSAHSLQNKLFVWLSVFGVVVSYASLYIPWVYHPLLAALIALILFAIPGFILRRNYKNRT